MDDMRKTSNSMTARELMDFIVQAGEALGWGKTYQGLARAAARAVFDATGTDWQTGLIPLDPESRQRQKDALADAFAKGNANTKKTYTATWDRVSGLAWELLSRLADRGDEGEQEFWNKSIQKMRDKRVLLRRVRFESQRTPLEQRIPMQLRKKREAQPESGERIQVARILIGLEAGPATLLLPEGMTQNDVLTVMEAVLQHAKATAKPQG